LVLARALYTHTERRRAVAGLQTHIESIAVIITRVLYTLIEKDAQSLDCKHIFVRASNTPRPMSVFQANLRDSGHFLNQVARSRWTANNL
jgi:hypothetical protein